MASITAMSFEKLVSQFPLRVNPVLSILYMWVLAYIPHFLKQPYVRQKLKEEKAEFDVAKSRQQGVRMADSSPVGLVIAAHAGCHQNSLEAFSLYATSLLIAMVVHVDLDTLQAAAGAFLFARVLYTVVYLSPLNGPMRSLSWAIGVFICIGLLLSAYERFLIFGYNTN